MSRLFAHERNGACRRRSAEALSGVAHHAAWHVHRNKRQFRSRDRVQRLNDRLGQRAAETGTKQGVDDQRGAVDRGGSHRVDAPAPAQCMQPCVAAQVLELAEQGNSDRPAGRCQLDAHHETVAAVIARAAQHGDGSRRPPAENFADHGFPGILHQCRAGRSGCNGRTIGRVHLRDAEERSLQGSVRQFSTQIAGNGTDEGRYRHGERAPKGHSQRTGAHIRVAHSCGPSAEKK